MRPTEDVVTVPVLLDLFGVGPDDDVPLDFSRGVIPTCAGEWRRSPDMRWQFFADDE